MLQFLANASALIVKIIVVLSINVSLFIIVPVSHSLLAMLKEDEKKVLPQKRIVAEMVKRKEPEKQVRKRTRIRSVSDASSRPVQSTMKFKFSPDLSVAGAGDGVAIQQQELETEVFEEGDVDQDAAPISLQAPPYPRRAKDLAIEGTVVVTFVVGEDGKVGTIENIDAPHPSFSAAFRTKMQSWKFSPAMKKGVPVKQRLRLPVDYALD